MKKSLLVISLMLLFVNASYADDTKYKEPAPQMPAFFDNVKLHGDIRAKWTSIWGGYEEHVFKTEATMGCDYKIPEAWVSVKMKAATSNGKGSVIFLDKAFLGKTLYTSDNMGISLEVGRNKMDSMFDSK